MDIKTLGDSGVLVTAHLLGVTNVVLIPIRVNMAVNNIFYLIIITVMMMIIIIMIIIIIIIIIVSITKFSIVIGSPPASHNRRAITWVSNYRCPI